MHPSKRIPYYKAKYKIFHYQKIYKPWKIFCIRHKKRIRVVFALADLSCWKTESLYKAMLAHKRFEPIIVLVHFPGKENYADLINYCTRQGYDYERISEDETICNKFAPDIILYQQPYEYTHIDNHMYHHNMRALFCYVIYSMRSSINEWATHLTFLDYCWQVYYENDLNLSTYRELNSNHASNGLVTGLPVMDDLLVPKSDIADPWKPSAGKKRIIYAPHHTIIDNPMFQTSTFLEYGLLMLDLAEKYSDRIQWAFKPHPFLRVKLEQVWGKEATDDYYNRWANAGWSQLETGEYVGLFKHSDAMIHDCGSFTMEYMFTQNPVLYLMRQGDAPQQYNEMHKRALALHYHAYTKEDIEKFIINVIDGNDPLATGREQYKRDYLIPPGGRTACDNIITAILG